MRAHAHPAASALAAFARLLTGVRPQWRGFYPDAKQRVYYANHTSHLDALIIWATLPSEVRAVTRPVAARDYWMKSAPRRYFSGKVFHAVLIDRPENNPTLPLRASLKVIDQMLDAMGEGCSLIVFPEGTRGSGADIKPFKSGLYYLASRRPALECVPVYLDNMNRILPKGEILPVPLLGTVTFGAPLRISPGEAKREFLERARQALLALRKMNGAEQTGGL
jgi:1-acyl-sn-glycerol-3-phosphate acyltransferase